MTGLELTDAADPSMLARLEYAKLEAMKELAYGASHEINNPLANIAARAQTLLRDEDDPERRRALEAIHQQALRAHEMISDLMLFARPPRLELRPVQAAELLGQVAGDFSEECRRREIVLLVAAENPPPPFLADEGQLRVAVGALCRNAVEAIGRNGRVELAAFSPLGESGNDSDAGSRVRLEVRDDGPGISPEVRQRIFDPFFSGREAGRGLGFGLSKAWRIVTDHGGVLTAVETPPPGAIFRIELPAAATGR